MEYASHLLTKQAPVPGDESSSKFQRQGGDPQGTSRIYLYPAVAQTNECLGLITWEHLVLKPDRWHWTRAVTLRNCIYSLNWCKTNEKDCAKLSPYAMTARAFKTAFRYTKKRLHERVAHRGGLCPPRRACPQQRCAQPAERTPRGAAAKEAPGGTVRNSRKTTNLEQPEKGVASKR